MLIHWVAPFLSAQLDHGFTIKRSGSLDYYQQPGMYWIRYEMVQLNSQCFHGNVLAVSILPVPSVDKHVFDLFPSPYAALLVSFESWLRCHAPSFLFFTHYSHWHLPAFFPSHMLSIDLPPPPVRLKGQYIPCWRQSICLMLLIAAVMFPELLCPVINGTTEAPWCVRSI